MKKRPIVLLFATVLVAGLAGGITGSPAGAAVTVDESDAELNADGDCSLLEALASNNNGIAFDACEVPADSTIFLPAGTYDVGPLADVLADITIVGAGASETVLDCSNSPGVCLNNLGVGSSLTLESLSMVNAPGQLLNQPFGSGPMRLENVVLDGSGHFAAASGDAPITVVDSTIRNTASAGVATASGNILVQDSTIEFSQIFGVSSESGDIDIVRSTVSGHETNAIYNNQGRTEVDSSVIRSNNGTAIRSQVGDISVVNTTIARNESKGITTVDGHISIESSTIVENGERAADYSGDGSVYVANSILANDGEECDNPNVTSGGHNISNDAVDSCNLVQPTDRVNTNPHLSSLDDHGGPTLTYLPLAGSPAIDTGGGCPGTDQRGEVRSVDGDADGTVVCDIGAVEVQSDDPETDDTPSGQGSGGGSDDDMVLVTPRFTG